LVRHSHTSPSPFTIDTSYKVTEDYSSYESVDEEEAPPPPKKPAKGKGKNITAPVKVKEEGAAEEKALKPLAKSASTLKRKPSKPSVQKGGIASYFSKK
jgi:DNA polymerase delta subunit 3